MSLNTAGNQLRISIAGGNQNAVSRALKKYGSLSHLWDFGVSQSALTYAATHTAAEFIAAYPLWPLWQDTAGTVPACKINDPVGLCKDQYGGAHASQATTTKRPILSGLVNLLTATEDFSSASWDKTGVTASSNSATAPNGALTACVVTATAPFGFCGQAVTGISGVSTKSVIYIRRKTGIGNVYGYVGSGSTTEIINVSSQWAAFPLTPSAGSAGTNVVGVLLATAGDAIEIWHPDTRPTNSPTNIPAYQRVTSATDYDTVGFPVRALFDGVDDCLVVPSLDLSMTDKVTVVAGVMKLSDAATGMVCELESTNGTFYLAASITSGTYRLASKGTTQADNTVSGYIPPISNIISGLLNVSGPSNKIKINGGTATEVTSSQGTGNYGSNALYIGQRAGTSLPFNGAIQSLAVIGNLLPDGEVQILEASANAAMGKVY